MTLHKLLGFSEAELPSPQNGDDGVAVPLDCGGTTLKTSSVLVGFMPILTARESSVRGRRQACLLRLGFPVSK